MNIEVFKKYLFLVIFFLAGACHKGDPASKGDLENDKIRGKWILDDSFSICAFEPLGGGVF